MGSMNINFAEVEGGFETLPEGMYPVIVERVEVRESKSSDHNYFNWELKVTDDDHENARLWMITSLSPKALFRLKDVFEALGVLTDDMDLAWDEDVDITPSEGPLLVEPDVIGLACVAVVKNEVYDGKERNRVDEIRPEGEADGAAPAKATGTKKATPAGKGRSGRRALR